MKQPVALFEKKSMKLYLFLKSKSQEIAYIINTVACCLHKRKDVRKTVKMKIGKSFLELICFIFYSSFKNNTLRLCVFTVCFLFNLHQNRVVGKGGQRGREHQPPSPHYFLEQNVFFHVKLKNIKSLHVINICDFGLFIEQDKSDKK